MIRSARPKTDTAIILILMGVAGCSATTSSRFAHLSARQSRQLAEQISQQHSRQIEEDLRSAFAIRPPQNVLVLSGGGGDGAFGCGVLRGWCDAPGGRPTFDIVTGVSTGALMATFAFLGEPSDDLTLARVYTNLSDGNVHDGLFAPATPDSIFGTAPLQRLIARCVTAQTLRRVAQAHWQGRRLYVATVDLDAGEVVIWPLSKIAAEQGAAGLQRYRRILLAAASVPVVFPPVRIDGDLHVDAGLREAVFLRRAMLGVTQAYDLVATDRRRQAPVVWAIINGKLQTQPQATPDDLVDIGTRSLSLYTQSLQFFNVREVANVAAGHSPPFEFKYASLPPDLDASDPAPLAQLSFDTSRMRRLYQLGRLLGQRHNCWHNGPPQPDGDPSVPAPAGPMASGGF